MHRYSEYLSNEQIREIQLIQAEALKDFHDFCEANNLTYIGYAGTVIGAVRHKGFIPWDDDADVLMPREDYEKFIKLGARALGDKYFVQNTFTDYDYPHHFTRIRTEDTLMVQERFKDYNIHQGVFIDVFPMDVYPESERKRKKYLRSIMFHRYIRWMLIYERKGNSKDGIKMLAKKILSIFPKTFWFKQSEKSRRRYENEVIDPDVLQLGEFTLEVGREMMESVLHTRNQVYDRILVPYEDFEIYIPRDYHDVLYRYFGDYTQYPPIEGQISHHGIVVFEDNRNK